MDSPSSTIPCSFSDESRRGERKRTKNDKESGVHALLSKSTTMTPCTPSVAPSTSSVTPSTSSVAPSTSIPKSEIYVSLLSTLRMAPTTSKRTASNKMKLSISRTPSTPIPSKFEWIHDASTPEERCDFLNWARSVAQEKAESEDLDECDKILGWASYIADSAASAPEDFKEYIRWAHSTSTMAAPVECKWRFLKWAHSTSTIQRKSWSLQEEISKPFETALKLFQEEINQNEMALKYGCSDLKQEHMIYTCNKGKHGVYQCHNALWIWPKLRNSRSIYVYQSDGGLKRVGKKIKEKFPESVMLKGRPTVNRFGFVTIKLSGKWIAKSIQQMLKDGIDTWAPKLPVERVIVDCPSLFKEMRSDLFQQHGIASTQMRILEYSKVDVTMGHPVAITQHCSHFDVKEDLLAMWFGLCEQKADWILYVTPIHLLEYIEMCFTAAKLKWIPSDRHKPPRTSCAGYRNCTAEGVISFLDKDNDRWVAVEQGVSGESAKLLGYTAEAVADCVITFTVLKKHRLAELVFDIDEMFKEEGNTFLYLLNTRAKLRRITDDNDFRKDIKELKKASEFILEELILEKAEGWEKGEERILGFHLLEFTEALEESCLSVLPHILCEYLYDLSKKFNSYYSSVLKVGCVRETSTLLLCEATAVVTEKCFHLLGITPPSYKEVSLKEAPALQPSFGLPLDIGSSVFGSIQPRYPHKNSRLEVFSFRTAAIKQFDRVLKGEVFGLISVSDKYGVVSDGGSRFYKPDFAHVPLFNHDWCNPVETNDWGLVYLGNPCSSHSVPLTSSIELRMELYVAKKKNACYQLRNHKVELDLSNFWEEESESACGVLTVEGEDGPTYMFYALLKEAVDVALDVKFETSCDRKVRGYVAAYYGDGFFYKCNCPQADKDSYMALLFLPNTSSVLTSCNIPIIRSVLAVPTKGSLIIKAYLEDESGKVIIKNSFKFKSQLQGCSIGTINGSDCSFTVKVDWKFQAQWYL